MKQKLRLIGISALALLLALAAFSMPALAEIAPKNFEAAFDYGVADDSQNEKVSAEELIRYLVGTNLADSEREYLNTLSGITFRYSNAIPDSNISTQYDSEDRNSLKVWVRPYSYTANNGAVVEWIPKSAQIGNRTLTLTKQDDRYGCVFEDLNQSSDFYMDVSFEWSVAFPAETVSELVNLAFVEGNTALNKLLAYEVALNEYNAKMDAYNAYQQYLSAKVEYDAYLVEKQKFDAEMQKYLEYAAAYEKYLADKKHYDELNEAWDKYNEYKKNKENYYTDLDNYIKFQAKIDVANTKLKVLENLFVIDSNNWQLYRSLMGNLVSMVLLEENKAQLVAAGCNRKDVDKAGEAAVKLRALMEPYAKLRDASYATENARTIALYSYYVANYEAMKTTFSDLCTRLNSLCDCWALITNLANEGKLLHYRQFVGLLYVTATNLDDSMKIEPRYRINGQQVSTLVDADMFLPDESIANPSNLTVESIATEYFPPKDISVEVPVPTETRPREEPEAPSPVVSEPTNPPTEVEDPGKNGIPAATNHPGVAPTSPELTDLQRALAEDIRSGKLSKRAMSSVKKSYSATASVKRLVPIDNRKLISFYAWDGKTLLSQQLVAQGSVFTDQGISTYRPPTNEQVYEFVGWRLPDGSECDFIADSDITLIAQYKVTPRLYTVTWILNGDTVTEKYLYGEMPTDPFGEPTPEEGYYFVFSGWSPAISEVTSDAVYEAVRTKHPNLYQVTWDIDGTTITEMLPYLTLPVFPTTPSRAPDTMLYTFIGWSSEVVPITENVTYKAQFSETPLAVSQNGTVYHVDHTATDLVITCTENLVDLRVAAEYAQKTGKGLILHWNRFTLTLSPESVRQLYAQNDCIFLGITSETTGVYETADIKVAFLGENGEISSAVPMNLKITAPNQATDLDFYLLENNTWQKVTDNGTNVIGGFVLRTYPAFADQVSAVIVDCMQSDIDLRDAANYAWGIGKDLVLLWGDMTLTVDLANLDLLYSASDPIHLGAVSQTTDAYGVTETVLSFYADATHQINLALPMTLDITSSKEQVLYLLVSGGWQKINTNGTAVVGGFALRSYPASEDSAIVVDCKQNEVDLRVAANYAWGVGKNLILQWENITLTVDFENLHMLYSASNPIRLGVVRQTADGYGVREIALSFCFGTEQIDLALPMTLEVKPEEGQEFYLLENGAWRKLNTNGEILAGGFALRSYPVSADHGFAMIVDCMNNAIDLRGAATHAMELGKSLVLQWGDITLTVAPANLELLYSSTRPIRLGIADQTVDAYGIAELELAFYSDSEKLDLALPMRLYIAPSKELEFYLLENGEWRKINASGENLVGGFALRSYPVSADQGSAMLVDCMQNTVDLRVAANYAWGLDKGLILKWGDVMLMIAPENLYLLHSAPNPIQLRAVKQTVSACGVTELELAFYSDTEKLDLALPMLLYVNSSRSLDFYLLVNGEWRQIDASGTNLAGEPVLRSYPVSPEHGFAMIVDCVENKADLREAASYASAVGKNLLLKWEDLLLTVDSANLHVLASASAPIRLGVVHQTVDAYGVAEIELAFYSGADKINLSLPMTLDATAFKEQVLYLLVGGEWQKMVSNKAAVVGGFDMRAYPVSEDSAVFVDCTKNAVDLRVAANYAWGVGKNLILQWEEITLTVDFANLHVLSSAPVPIRLGLANQTTDAYGVSELALAFYNGSERYDLALPMTLCINVSRELEFYLLAGGEWQKMESNETAVTGGFALRSYPVSADTAIVVDCKQNEVDLREAANYAWGVGKDLVLRWGNITLTIDFENLDVLYAASNPIRLGAVRQTTDAYGVTETALSFYFGTEQVDLALPMSLTVNSTAAQVLYLLENGEWHKMATNEAAIVGGFVLRSYPVSNEPAVTVDCKQNNVDLRMAANYAWGVGKSLILKWEHITLTVDLENLPILSSASNPIRLGTVVQTADEYGVRELALSFYSNAEKLELAVPMTLCVGSAEEQILYLLENGEWKKLETDETAVVGGFDLRSYPVSAESAIVVDCTQNNVDLRVAANYAWGVGKDLILCWENVTLTVEFANLHVLSSASDPIRLGVVKQTTDAYGVREIAWSFYSNEEKIDLALPMTLQITAPDSNKKTEFHVLIGGEWQKMDAEVLAVTGAFAVRTYALSKIYIESNAVIDPSEIPLRALAGTLIDLSVIGCEAGKEFSNVSVKLADGTDIPVENMKFYMPDSEVFIVLTVSEVVIEYEVIFRIDGTEIVQKYHYGDAIIYPPTPTKPSDGVYDYTFSAWSKDVRLAIGEERTIVIDAIFESAPVVVDDPFLSGNNNNYTLTVLAPIIGGGLFVLIVGLVIFLKIRKKRKKAKLMADTAAEPSEESEETDATEESTSENDDQ